MNIDEIMVAIPHRYPFLLVDGVRRKEESEIEAFKNVTYNEPFFQGHFPNYPLMPAVLQVEGVAQTAALLLHEKFQDRKGLPLFLGIDNARFFSEVRPGDQLVYFVRIKQQLGDFFKVSGQIKVGEKIVMKCILLVGVKYSDENQ